MLSQPILKICQSVPTKYQPLWKKSQPPLKEISTPPPPPMKKSQPLPKKCKPQSKISTHHE